MSLCTAIKNNVPVVRDYSLRNGTCKSISAYFYEYYSIIESLFSLLHGRFIDIGCGDMQHRTEIMKHVDSYEGIDIQRNPYITYLGDIENMAMIKDNTYDSAACLEVFEHLKNPHIAIKEIHRILKPGGLLIFSTPFMNRIHSEPHDYYRYTKYGLQYLFETAGFGIQLFYQIGGLFGFVGHQISVALLSLLWGIPPIGRTSMFLNRLFFVPVCRGLDKIFKTADLFPSGYICAVRKHG